MKAAVEARAGSDLKILAVTVLTSYDDGDLHAAGYRLSVSDLVEARAQQAQVLGVDGLVSSPEEAAALRKIVGHQMQLVTPGIRPAGAASGDQKRIMTPARAIAAGADYLVVGRPITEAADPKACGGCHPGRNRSQGRLGAEARANEGTNGETHGKRLLDRARRCSQRWTATRYTSRRTPRSSRNTARKFLVRGGKFEAMEGTVALAQCRARIQGLRDRARLLQFAGISRLTSRSAQPHSRATSSSSRAMTARSPEIKPDRLPEPACARYRAWRG